MLAKVAQDAGPNARLARVTRVRRGGIGGFFAKERYEIEVEEDDAEEVPFGGWPGDGDGDAVLHRGGSEDPPPSHSGGAPGGVLEGSSESVSTFEDVLQSVDLSRPMQESRVEARPEPRAVRAWEPTRSTTFDQGSQNPTTGWRAPVLEAGDRGREATTPAVALLQQELGAFEAPDIPSQVPLARFLAPKRADGDDHELLERKFALEGPASSTAEQSAGALPEQGATRWSPSEQGTVKWSPGEQGAGERGSKVVDGAVTRPDGARSLSRLGLPQWLIAGSGSQASRGEGILAALSELPRPVFPQREGPGILAIVGDGERCIQRACEMHLELGGAGDGPYLAERGEGYWTPSRVLEEHRISRMEEARWLGRESAQRRHISVVAVSSPLGGRRARWASQMLATLAPTTTWVVVDATVKTSDIQTWMDGLGRVDALVLERVDETSTPASVLELGLPVALIEGRRATPEAWAALLSERLQEGWLRR